MIPLKLTIHNFLSYKGTHQLDLENTRSLIITGDNGAGKSSILDAILFALFGYTRISNNQQSSANIIHFEETMAFSEFTFLLHDACFRIKRSTNPIHSLEIKERKRTNWKNITKESDQETQTFIEKALHINLNSLFMTTIMSSSFYHQKDFLDYSEEERYQRLAGFLGLSLFQNAYDHTQKDLFQYSVRKQVLEEYIHQNKNKFTQKKALQKILDEEIEKKNQLEIDLTKIKDSIECLEIEIVTIRQQLDNKSHLMDQIHQLRNFQNDQRKEKSKILEALNQLQQSISLQHEIENGYKQLLDLIQRNKILNENLEQRQRIELQMNEIQNCIEQEEMELKVKRNELEQKEMEYSQEKSLLPDLNFKMHDIQSKLKEMGKQRYQIEKLEQEKNEIQNQISSLNENTGMLKQERVAILETYSTISKQISDHEQVIQKELSTKKKLQTIRENKEKVKLLQSNIEIEYNKKKNLESQNEKFSEMAIQLKEKIRFLELPKTTENRCPLCGTPLSKDKEADILLNYRRDLEMRETTLEKNANTIQRITTKIESLQSEILILSADFDQEEELQNLYMKIQECKSTIGKITENHYRAKLQESKIEEEMNKVTHKIANLKSRFKTIDKQYVEAMFVVSNQSVHENSLSELHLQISSALEADQKLPSVTKQLIDIKRRIETKNYATDQWKKVNDLKLKFFAIHYSAQEHENIKNKINQLKYFETEKRIMDEKLNEKGRILNQLNDIEDKLEELDTDISILVEKIKNIAYQKNDLEEAETNVEKFTHQKDSCTQEKEDVMVSIAKHERDMEIIFEVQKEFEKSQKELDDLHTKTQIVTFCQQVFSDQNLPTYILYRVLPLLERDVNRILRSISKETLTVYISVNKDSMYGQQKISVSISNINNTIDFPYLSQGERFCIHIAFRLALSRLLQQSKVIESPFLCIDNDFGSLDFSSKHQIMYTLLRIQEHFNKVFLISHNNEFQNSFDQH
ncbi:MAG: SMC family ATPase [Caldisericia bacterium]|nr:SMC family ATPase [Caldisericia bacterium]